MWALWAAVGLSTNGLLVGRATMEITPPEPLPLGGYTDRKGALMDAGGEPLFARAIYIEQGSARIAVVSAEMLTIPESLAREVRARIPADVHVFLTATHTHSAPDSQMLNERMTFAVPGIASFKRPWLEWYAVRIALTVIGAIEAAKERFSLLGANVRYLDLNRPRRLQTQPIKLATAITFEGNGHSRPAFFHYAAHPVFLGAEHNSTSGDWPGAVAAKGQMVLLGPIGGVSPNAKGATPRERIENFAEIATRETRGARTLAADRLKWIIEPIELGEKRAHPDFARQYKVPDALAQAIVKPFAPEKAEVSAFRVGKVAFVGIPGEPSSSLGRRIVSAGLASGFTHVLVVSHVNGWMGYILDGPDYDRGGYEATLSFYGREQGDRVVAAAERALRGLAQTP